MLYDAHNHLQFEELTPHLETIAHDLAAINLGGAVVNGTHPNDWDDVVALAERFSWVTPSFGIHPWDVAVRPDDWQLRFIHYLEAHPHAHVGEIGLDRWILEPGRDNDPMLDGVPPAPIEEQMKVCAWQLRWAADHNRAATIHCVRAWGPLLEVLRSTPLPERGFLLHAYGGSPEQVAEFTKLGAYFSYNTSLIDPRKTRQRRAFQVVPTDRLLVETDAPAFPPPDPIYTLPNQKPGTWQNHPANLAMAYADLARLRGEEPTSLEANVAENFKRLIA
ncbi:MAG: TatD family hydrolase [Opitutaceae bacterium]|nr:TatD family hydrolase [Opitutaceae bacterium]